MSYFVLLFFQSNVAALEWPPGGLWRPPGDLWIVKMAFKDVHLLNYPKSVGTRCHKLHFLPALKLSLCAASRGLWSLLENSMWPLDDLKWPLMMFFYLVWSKRCVTSNTFGPLQIRLPSHLQEASGDLQVTSGWLEMASNNVHLLNWAKPVETRCHKAHFWPDSNSLLCAASSGLQEASGDLQVTSGWLEMAPNHVHLLFHVKRHSFELN